MKNNTFDVRELWRQIEGVTDQDLLRKALQELKDAIDGRRISTEEQTVFMYLKARV